MTEVSVEKTTHLLEKATLDTAETSISSAERTDLIRTKIAVRPVASKDAQGVWQIYKEEIQHHPGATRDVPCSLSEIQSHVNSAAKAEIPHFVQLVAEGLPIESPSESASTAPPPAAPAPEKTGLFRRKRQQAPPVTPAKPAVRPLLGICTLTPFRASLNRGPRSCYNRAATFYLSVYESESMTQELRRAIQSELIKGTLAVCRERGFRYKTIVTELAFREDEPLIQDYVYLLQEHGFRIVGRLEGVIAKDVELMDVIALQLDLPSNK